MDETTNQVGGDDTGLPTVTDDSGVASGTEDQFHDEGEGLDLQNPPPEDEDEIELDGDLKLKLPKSQAEALRQHILRQADYTQKTQELAEKRKAVDAEKLQISQMNEQELNARGHMAALQREHGAIEQEVAQKYGNWDNFFEVDPFEAQKLDRKLRTLAGEFGNTKTFVEQASERRAAEQRDYLANALREGTAELARDIPDWSPDLSRTLQDFGAKTFNLSKDDFDGITDPRAVKLLYWAHKGHQAEQAATKAQAIQRQQSVTPAISTGGKGQFTPGITDDLPIGEYIRRRNAQEAKAKR